MLKDFLSPNNVGGTIKEIYSSVVEGIPTAVFGVSFSQKCHIACVLEGNVLYIVRDAEKAKEVKGQISSIVGEDNVVFLPSKNDVLLYKPVFDKENLYKRLTAIYKIKRGAKIVVTTFEALLQLFPKNLTYLTFEKNSDYDLQKTISNLVKIGYKRVDFCENAGTFSLRGDILEIFPINDEKVVRLDFFGDTLESIRYFGEQTELSTLNVVQSTDLLILENEVKDIITELKYGVNLAPNLMAKKKASSLYNKLVEKLEVDLLDDSLQYVMPLSKSVTHNFFECVNKEFTVVYDESKILWDNLNYLVKEHLDRVSSLRRNGDGLDFITEQFSSVKDLTKTFENSKKLALQQLNAIIPMFSPLKTFSIKGGQSSSYCLKPTDLLVDVQGYALNGYKVLLCTADTMGAERIYSELKAKRINVNYKDEADETLSGITVTKDYLPRGFIYHDSKLAVIGTDDLFIKSKQKAKTLQKKRGDLFSAPEVGDFAVHERFGIGLIKGVKRIETIEGCKDYVELEYAGGDRLYISTDQMDKLTKYLGGNETPTLSKIGGGEFERVKQRVRASIALMTINLKKLYNERKELRGYQFAENNELSEEFISSFEFEDTIDQTTSWDEIKKDMESAKVMDRLLCGDVGFGKTEIALRACFKAILDGKQSAIIAPTTILTEQHYMTALRRFKNYGVNVGVLNRFRTAKQQAKTLQDVKEGKIDLVIGTHRLFSKDVKFKDLGLLVIDEEQRFGVEHKEKLKLLAKNVDTLTLSATPIPRTLHMSLSGIRDISSINTPPKQRIPVQTVVAEFTDAILKDALTRELSRNGQAFILYNRVESIYSFKERVQSVMPNAKIIVAHGQMKESELENSVMAFYRGEADVLIATTIIENGIDMPRANTLIVESADKLGLSTLYQLKGRVGRGNLMAYAYFTYSEGKLLTDNAYKRLTALMEFSEMGSGYKIAMRDLEIRGAGNVLGKEQHGHLDKIGYELYSKLLKAELSERVLNQEVELDIKADAYIPEKYIGVEKARMDAYKQIAEISSLEDRKRVENSLIENYGKIPKSVMGLIEIATLKYLAESKGAIKLIVSMKVAKMYLNNLETLQTSGIITRLKEFNKNVTLSFEEVPVLTFDFASGNVNEQILGMINFLNYQAQD